MRAQLLAHSRHDLNMLPLVLLLLRRVFVLLGTDNKWP